MYMLKDLWHGNISPSERYICDNSEYKRISNQFYEEVKKFLSDMTPEKEDHYDKLEDLQFKLFDTSEQETFIVGFRLGARMILDVIGEYKGQFKTRIDT